jgi:signal transduction histidine kinase
MQNILDDLLDLSRIQSGKIELHRRRVSAESLVTTAIAGHRAPAEEKGVLLRSEVLPGVGETFADPDRLDLVFSNLLGNAIRFTPAGSEVVVRARPVEGTLRFEVTDSGPGIPVEHQAQLFEKFFRVPGAPSGGVGLGLFICKEIVIAHGGTIGVISTPGQGATFWFELPLAPETGAGAAA